MLEILNDSNRFWVSNIESNQDSDVLSIDISTKEHGACIEVHGDGIEVLERAEIILIALNQKELIK